MRQEGFLPVRLPAAVWSSEETRALLLDRRIGQLFLLAKKHAGASQARIAAATGLNQGEVSRIQRGERWVTAIDVLERIADGFAMPDPARVLLGLAPGDWAPEDNPPERAVPSPAVVVPAQLPPVVSGFVGRSTELGRLKEHRHAGCVVVTGPAGIGKTSLAVAWARAVIPEFPDGQLYVEVADPADALAGFLRALGAEVPPTLPERTALFRSVLAGKRVLIVVDGAVSAAQVRPLLPGDHRCLVVVTSRDGLDDLVVREGAARLRLDPMPAQEALDLVVQVAGRRRVEEDPATAGELVDSAGRVPLALRAAAVRLAGGTAEDPRSRRWPVLVGTLFALALAVIAGGAGLADVVDRATTHAVVATRNGQLALLRMLVLAGCGVLLPTIARSARRRPHLAAGCLLGVQLTTITAVVGRSPNGPPPLVDVVHLVGASVWMASLGITVAAILPAMRPGIAHSVALLVAVGGSWLLVNRLAGHGTATNQTYGQLLISGAALAFVILGLSVLRARRSRTPAGRPHVMAVAVLLVTALLAAVPGPGATRARQRAYDSVVYGRDIECGFAGSQTGADQQSPRLTVEAECVRTPCSCSPV
ncbi:NB-ARC domain-containing protein [Streptomyces sp. KR80]|uniref:NB-ARC domain-containing protein n=1 Tax=Streptomyces sp. KR80 TaxID=3457426 RepID=UPI003FD21D53